MGSDEPIDLRGTQGAVVLPHGTVHQHYTSAEPEMSPTNQSDQTLHAQIYNLTRDVADTSARVTATEKTVARMEPQLSEVYAIVQRLDAPRSTESSPLSIEMSLQSAFWMLMMIAAVVALVFGTIYFGGVIGG